MDHRAIVSIKLCLALPSPCNYFRNLSTRSLFTSDYRAIGLSG